MLHYCSIIMGAKRVWLWLQAIITVWPQQKTAKSKSNSFMWKVTACGTMEQMLVDHCCIPCRSVRTDVNLVQKKSTICEMHTASNRGWWMNTEGEGESITWNIYTCMCVYAPPFEVTELIARDFFLLSNDIASIVYIYWSYEQFAMVSVLRT